MIAAKRRGRPSRHAHYDELLAGLKAGATKRPAYVRGVGVFKGEKSTTAWVKVTLRKGGIVKGKTYAPGQSREFKLGRLSSWTWDALEAERDRLQGLADRGEPLEEAQARSFSDQAADWLSLKVGTAGYAISDGIIRKHLAPAFGQKAVRDVVVSDIDRWLVRQMKDHKPATVQRQLGTLKAILNHAVKVGLLDRNPANAVEPVRGIEPRRRHLEQAEWEAVLEAAGRVEQGQESREKYPDHELKGWLVNYLRWALHSGMRRGEILTLRLDDIRAAPNGRLFAEVRKSKSGHPRQVTCTDDMVGVVEQLRALKREPSDERLFPVSLSTVKRKLAKVWELDGLEDVRLHDFRRTHATQLVHSGVDLWGVANRLGHRDLKMLERVYAVPLNDQRVADQAQNLFKHSIDAENA